MKHLNQSIGRETPFRGDSLARLVKDSGRCDQKSLAVADTAKGFTLIEMMITVAIVAILAAIAYPSYTSYIQRAHRTEAKSGLLQMATGEEKFYLVSSPNTYTNVTANVLPASASSTYYNFTVPTVNAALPTTFTVTATAKNSQLYDTDCKTLSLTSAGVKSATKSDGSANDAACWAR